MLESTSKWLSTNDKAFSGLHTAIDKQWRMGKNSDQDEFNRLQHWLIGETQRISDAISVIPELVGRSDLADLAINNLQDTATQLQDESDRLTKTFSTVDGKVRHLADEMTRLDVARRTEQEQVMLSPAPVQLAERDVIAICQRMMDERLAASAKQHQDAEAELLGRIATLEKDLSDLRRTPDDHHVSPTVEQLVSDMVAMRVQAEVEARMQSYDMRSVNDMTTMRQELDKATQRANRMEREVARWSERKGRMDGIERGLEDMRSELSTFRPASVSPYPVEPSILSATHTSSLPHTTTVPSDHSHAAGQSVVSPDESQIKLVARFVIQQVLEEVGPYLPQDRIRGNVDSDFDHIMTNAVDHFHSAAKFRSRPPVSRSSHGALHGDRYTIISDISHLAPEKGATGCEVDVPEQDNKGDSQALEHATIDVHEVEHEVEVELELGVKSPRPYGDISLSRSTSTPALITSDSDSDAFMADLTALLGRPILERCKRMDEVMTDMQQRFEALLADGKRGRVASLVANVSHR